MPKRTPTKQNKTTTKNPHTLIIVQKYWSSYARFKLGALLVLGKNGSVLQSDEMSHM